MKILRNNGITCYNPIPSVGKVRYEPWADNRGSHRSGSAFTHVYYTTSGGTMIHLSTNLLRTRRFLPKAKAGDLRAYESR